MTIINTDYFSKSKDLEKERRIIKKQVSDQKKKIAMLEKELSDAEDELCKIQSLFDDFEFEYPKFLKKCSPMSEAPKDGTLIFVYDRMSCYENELSAVSWRTNQAGETGWFDQDDDDYVRSDHDLVGFMMPKSDDRS